MYVHSKIILLLAHAQRQGRQYTSVERFKSLLKISRRRVLGRIQVGGYVKGSL
jgi:hypothetical protein